MTAPERVYRRDNGENRSVETLEIIQAKEDGGLDQSDRRGHLCFSERSVLTGFADYLEVAV